MGTPLGVVIARLVNKTAEVIAPWSSLQSNGLSVFSYYHLYFKVLPFLKNNNNYLVMGESLDRRILVITSEGHKIDFSLSLLIFFISAKKVYVPRLEFIFVFSAKYPSQDICDLVVFKFIKKIRKYSEARKVICRFLLLFISPWPYKN